MEFKLIYNDYVLFVNVKINYIIKWINFLLLFNKYNKRISGWENKDK